MNLTCNQLAASKVFGVTGYIIPRDTKEYLAWVSRIGYEAHWVDSLDEVPADVTKAVVLFHSREHENSTHAVYARRIAKKHWQLATLRPRDEICMVEYYREISHGSQEAGAIPS